MSYFFLQASVAVGSVGKPEYINAQVLTAHDGTSLAYGNTAPYGKQHPSYVQQVAQTRVGSNGVKKLDTSSDVVYGKVLVVLIDIYHTPVFYFRCQILQQYQCQQSRMLMKDF